MGKFVKPDPGIQTRAHEETQKLKSQLPKGRSTGRHAGEEFGHTTKN